jgi:hypothetical protein
MESPSSAERESANVYGCITVAVDNQRISDIYNRAIDEILSNRRETVYGYSDGMTLYDQDIKDSEKEEVLVVMRELFEKSGVTYQSCYVDMLGKDRVNLFRSNSSRLCRVCV